MTGLPSPTRPSASPLVIPVPARNDIAPFALQRRGDVKHGPLSNAMATAADVPLKPVGVGAVGKSPSGRQVEVCVYSPGDLLSTVASRQRSLNKSITQAFCFGLIAGGFTGAAYQPDHPGKALGAIMGAFAAPPSLLAFLQLRSWHRSDQDDIRSRMPAALEAAEKLSPLEQLNAHIENSNRETLSNLALGDKAISFAHKLRNKYPVELTDADVGNAIARLTDGAASVLDWRSFGQITRGLAQLAISHRCEPAVVMDQLVRVWHSAQASVGVINYVAQDRLAFLQEREYQIAAAVVQTLAVASSKLSQETQAQLHQCWTTLADKDANMHDVFQFATDVLHCLDPYREGQGLGTVMKNILERPPKNLRRLDGTTRAAEKTQNAASGVRAALPKQDKSAASTAQAAPANRPLPLEPTSPSPSNQAPAPASSAEDQV